MSFRNDRDGFQPGPGERDREEREPLLNFNEEDAAHAQAPPLDASMYMSAHDNFVQQPYQPVPASTTQTGYPAPQTYVPPSLHSPPATAPLLDFGPQTSAGVPQQSPPVAVSPGYVTAASSSVSSNAVPPVQENYQTAAYGGATVPPNVGAAPVNSQPYGSVQYYAPAYLFHPSAPPPQQVPLFTLPAPLGSYMPVSAAGTVPFPLDFQSGIFDCLEEVESLVVGCCCWQLLAVQTNAHLQGRPQLELQDWAYCLGMTLVNVCVGWPVANYGVTYTNRRTMRQRFGMSTDTVLEDMCLVAFCGVCLECQQAREMKYRSGMLVPPTVGTQMVRQDSMV